MPRWVAAIGMSAAVLAMLAILVSAWLGDGPSGDCPTIGHVIAIGCR